MIAFLLFTLFESNNPINSKNSKNQENTSDNFTSTIINSAQASKEGSVNSSFLPPYVKKGFDWSLPIDTSADKNAGLIGEYNGGTSYVYTTFIFSRWDIINPEKNRFNFASLDAELKKAKGKKVLIRLEVNSACEAPKWALKHLRSTRNKSLVFWDKSYPKLLKPLIHAFAKKYANNPQIIGVQLGIGDGEYKGSCKEFSNKDGWGEFWMTPVELKEAESQFGLTPALFEKRSKEIIDVYVAAFVGNEGKLAFTNAEPYFSWGDRADPYNKLMYKLADYVFTKGLGNRDGEIENWMRYVDKAFGMGFESLKDGTCRLTMDEAFATKIIGRYWGTENEFYGDIGYVLDEEGPYHNQAYRFYVSSLRSLQMRRNYSSILEEAMQKLKDPVYKTQDFLHYLSKTMGKQMNNTPDVFVLLGERYIQKFRVKEHTKQPCFSGNKIAIRSFGRWLKEESNSQASLKINMPKHEKYWGQGIYLPDGIDYEYAARSSTRFQFDLNDQLAKMRCLHGCDAVVKVTYKDDFKTSLRAIVAEGSTNKINTVGDGKIKTASFPVKSKFKNQLGGQDFIISTGEKPLSVMLIRMNLLSQ